MVSLLDQIKKAIAEGNTEEVTRLSSKLPKVGGVDYGALISSMIASNAKKKQRR